MKINLKNWIQQETYNKINGFVWNILYYVFNWPIKLCSGIKYNKNNDESQSEMHNEIIVANVEDDAVVKNEI